MRIIFLTTISLLCSLSSCKHEKKEVLHIAVAANLQYAMEELTDEFTAMTGIACELVISSSGRLTAQILEGAPYDLFLSADMKYPGIIYREGKARSRVQIYAYGKLVLWSRKGPIPDSLYELTGKQYPYIAMANPDLAPYGRATRQVLHNHGLWEKLSDKLVLGESISQVNQFIISGAAPVGFTAKSVVLSPEISGKGHWLEMSQADHDPIEQGMILIQREGGNFAAATEFGAFLLSENSAGILEKYGYTSRIAE